MIKYVFRDGPLPFKNSDKADPQVLGEALAELSNGAEPDPEALVNAARNRHNPWHQHFEWNDAKLAHAARIDQARMFIRLFRVEDEKTGDVEPAYVNITTDTGRAYHPVENIKQSVDLQLALMKQAKRDLDAWTKRYRVLQDLCLEAEKISKKLDKRIRDKTETRTAAA